MQKLAEEGEPPRALLEQPEIWPHLAWVWDAFNDLSSDRPFGAMGGAGRIPWSSIDRYAARHGIDDPDAFDRFKRLLGAMDRAYLDHEAERAKQRDKRKVKKR
ncbi:MAG TPA: hypothetical protein VHL98_11150 [Microvirga sp.]|nr:hypothetical protein [Microvirga sp.]